MAKPQAMVSGSESATSLKQTAMQSTFVTTDSHNFKETVQRLTGLSEVENLPVTIPERNSSRGRGVADIRSDGNSCAVMKNMIGLGPQKESNGNFFSQMKNMNGLDPQKPNGNCEALVKNMIDLGPQKSVGMKNMIDLGPQKSVGMKNMIDLGPQKTEYRVQKRRKVDRKLEINLGFSMNHTGNSHKYVSSPTLMPSPISPFGEDLFSSYSYSPSYSSTPTSYNQSPFLEEEEEEFRFRPLPSLKIEPKLLNLFPLTSLTEHYNT